MKAGALGAGTLLLSLLVAGCGPSAGITVGAGASCQLVKPAGAVQMALTEKPCPARAGRETFVVKLLDGSGRQVTASTATIRYWMLAMDMPGLPRDVPLSSGDGGMETSLPLGMSGPWMLRVSVDGNPNGPVTADFQINVQ